MERTDKKWTEALDWLRYVLNPVIEAPTVKDRMALIEFAEQKTEPHLLMKFRFKGQNNVS